MNDMKKLLIVLAAIMFLAISYSCSEDFLEKRPLGSTDETVFYNEKGINALMIGVYGGMTNAGWGASVWNWTYGSAASDDAYKGSEDTDQVPANEIERWEVMVDNSYPSQMWTLTYGRGVHRANEVLRIIGLAEGLSASAKDRLTAEARFLRAFYYFQAWLVFGDRLPIITEETEDRKKVSNDNAPGTLLAFIINDLKFAWENLPESQPEPGRPTKYAAMGLAARAYLQELKYSEAKPLLDNIINSNKYQLMPKYYDNYSIANRNNLESIFEIQRSVNDGSSGSLNGEMGIGLNAPHGSDIGMCCGFHQPSQNLVNAFRVNANGLPVFDQVNVHLKHDQGIASAATFVPFEDEVDPRLDWTVGRRGIPMLDWGICRGRDWIRDQSNGGPYMPALKPFFRKEERFKFSTQSGWQTGVNANNMRYLRLTHILLWRAEVAAFEGDLDRAKDLVNQVRRRAANQEGWVMGRVLIHELPPAVYPWGEGSSDADFKQGGAVDWTLPAANYKIGEYESFGSPAEAMRAVQWELRLEFATEGMRFFDLRRWDKLQPASLNSVPMAATLNAFQQGDMSIRTFMSGAAFTERDKYQPIPQTQIDLQPGVLIQNPNY
jgi:starch-binding outer membrane protein, SusD/RagB family